MASVVSTGIHEAKTKRAALSTTLLAPKKPLLLQPIHSFPVAVHTCGEDVAFGQGPGGGAGVGIFARNPELPAKKAATRTLNPQVADWRIAKP